MIVWGTRIKRVACEDAPYFCAICRSMVQLKTWELRRVPHLYFISLGKGDHLLDEGTCDGCRTVYGFVPGLLRPTMKKEGGLKYLSESGLPSLNNEARAALEERVAERRITGDERIALIAEPFKVLEYDLRRRASDGSQESVTSVVTLLFIILLIGAAMLWYSYFERKDSEWLPWAIGSTLGAGGLLFWLVRRVLSNYRRAATGEFVERIAMSLAALRPSPSEIDWTLKELRQAGNPVAAALTTEQLMRLFPST